MAGVDAWDEAQSSWDKNFQKKSDKGACEGAENERKNRRDKTGIVLDLVGGGVKDDANELSDNYLWVFVFKNEEHDKYEMNSEQSAQYRMNRVEFVSSCKSLGMGVKKHKSRDKDENIVKLYASQDKLEDYAETMKFPVKLKKGGYVPFIKARRTIYWCPRDWEGSPSGEEPLVEDGDEDPTADERDFKFTASEKCMLVYNILETRQVFGGAGFDLGKMKIDGNMEQFFPAHQKMECEWLGRNWASFSLIFTAFLNQPLDRIKEYFGPQIGLYFTFLGFYAKSLAFPAICGLFAYAIQQAQGRADVKEAIPFIAIIQCFYGTFLLEGWKRREITQAFRWGQIGFESSERVRPEFEGEIRLNPVTSEPELYSSENIRSSKMCTSTLIAIISAVIVAFGIALILGFKRFLQVSLGSQYGAIAGIAQGILIGVFNAIYAGIAVKMTDWENQRTETSYCDSLILKSFLFQFVNSYAAFYFVAFVKPNENDFGLGGFFGSCDCFVYNQNGCNMALILDKKPPTCTVQPCSTMPCACTPQGTSCIDELATLMFSIFVLNLAIGNLQEVVIPMVMTKINIYLEERAYKQLKEKQAETGLPTSADETETADAPLCQAEYEAKMAEYEGTFGDYNEMILQYGYVTLFGACLPLCAFLAMANNMIEVRSDATKMLKAIKRPIPSGAEDIGSWYMIMDLMTFAAVFTNCGLVWFVSGATVSLSATSRVWGFIISEHIIIMFKSFCAFAIPDVPEKTQIAMDKEEYRLRKEDEEGLLAVQVQEGKSEKEKRLDNDLYDEHDHEDVAWIT